MSFLANTVGMQFSAVLITKANSLSICCALQQYYYPYFKMGKKHTENDGISQDCSKTAGDRTQCNFQTALQNLDQTENRYSVQIILQKQ